MGHPIGAFRDTTLATTLARVSQKYSLNLRHDNSLVEPFVPLV